MENFEPRRYAGFMPDVTKKDLVEQWRSLQTSYLKTSNALERELAAQFGLGLNDFETLDLLADSHNECRMKDLTALSPMTQSALSKIVDRLQKAGLVERFTCDEDRRALMVGLTDSGITLHHQASVLHREVLASHLGD